MTHTSARLIFAAVTILAGNQVATAVAVFAPSIFQFSMAWFSARHGAGFEFLKLIGFSVVGEGHLAN